MTKTENLFLSIPSILFSPPQSPPMEISTEYDVSFIFRPKFDDEFLQDERHFYTLSTSDATNFIKKLKKHTEYNLNLKYIPSMFQMSLGVVVSDEQPMDLISINKFSPYQWNFHLIHYKFDGSIYFTINLNITRLCKNKFDVSGRWSLSGEFE